MHTHLKFASAYPGFIISVRPQIWHSISADTDNRFRYGFSIPAKPIIGGNCYIGADTDTYRLSVRTLHSLIHDQSKSSLNERGCRGGQSILVSLQRGSSSSSRSSSSLCMLLSKTMSAAIMSGGAGNYDRSN